MKLLINVQDRKIPVYFTKFSDKAMNLLTQTLNRKLVSGKKAVKLCLDTLISIEIIDNEAILHAFNEQDTVALSLY
ncbi:3-dehydroquinate dehydratase [Gordoniibacillus kamchatkensis]|uniref:3-dehydroquinate dehydratase n=1 Tax=Gordoniibacillus kamchatkensis TaxID=1590651 RepID=A0ABR5AM91_9BACL|nr:hypothetical protein [Paenibacillus sp. VKM B-2647]KIL42121.1 3-dehydroquinate dehydratase [Paenibacillus sp. VKM B-2647]